MIVRPVLCRDLIGRRDELIYLQERRREAGVSHGGLVLVRGEAGIGKSRLLSEFSSTMLTSRWRVGRGACAEFAQRPYGAILDVLARIEPGAATLVPAASKAEQFDAFADAFVTAASRNATLAIIEDIHWADVATMELLVHLAGRLATTRTLLVASMRPEAFHPEHPAFAALAKLERTPNAGRIDVEPLRGPELRTFIDEALRGFELGGDARRAVARAGEGNPFFTEELLKSAVERDASGRAITEALPTTVWATLMERLRPLDDNDRHVLGQAAVIGRSFRLDVLAQTLGTGLPDLMPAMRRARDYQLVEEQAPHVFRFRHALTREAIYGTFLQAELQPLHRTIALVLESARDERGSLEGLAYHWWAAGDVERSARYNELAGDAASIVYAHEDAVASYERALEADEIDPLVRGRILEKLATVRMALNLHDVVYTTYCAAAEAYRIVDEPEREAACRINAALSAYTNDVPEPTRALYEMLQRVAADEYTARARLHLGIAWIEATLSNPTEASEHLALVDQRAIDAAPDIRLRFHNVSAWVRMILGDLDGFRRGHAEWVAAAATMKRVGSLTSAHYNGALCYTLLAQHADAYREIDIALGMARAERNRHGESSALALAAFTYLVAGDLERAREALLAVPSHGNQVTAAHAAAWGSLAGAYLDDAALISRYFEQIETQMVAESEVLWAAGYAELMMRRGRTADAQALLHAAINVCERPRGDVLTLLTVGRYGTDEDCDRARPLLAVAGDAPTELIERHALSLFDAYVARRHGLRDAATEHARAAADGFHRIRVPLLEAAALEVAGDPEAALALYRRCGARYDVRRLEGERTESAPATAAPASDELSIRERQIATLVAAGRSNVEIARELHISHKTVEKHLGSIYRKLGFSSRSQLAVHASRSAESAATNNARSQQGTGS